MALQQLKDRYLYALQIWCGDNRDAFFVPYRYGRGSDARHANIRTALTDKMNAVEQKVAEGQAVILLSHEDNITNRDLKLDYKGKQILVGHAEATFIPPQLLYKAAMDADPYRRLPVKHIEYDRFMDEPELWEGFMRRWSAPGEEEMPNSHFILERDGQAVMACVSNSFWFVPGLKIDDEARPQMGERFERTRRALESLQYSPEILEGIHQSGRQHPALGEQDHAVLDDVLKQIRDKAGVHATAEDIAKVMGGIHIDHTVAPTERPVFHRLLLPAPKDAEQKLLLEQLPDLPLGEVENVEPPTLSGEFDVAVNAKGTFKLPQEWLELIDQDYITLFNQGTGELVCFNEDVFSDEVFEKIKAFGVGSHLFAFMQTARRNEKGGSRIHKDVLQTFRDAVGVERGSTSMKLSGHGNYFKIKLAQPEDIDTDKSRIGKWRKLDVSIQNFVNVLEEAKAPPSGPEQSH